MNENKITGTPSDDNNRAGTELSESEARAKYEADRAAAKARPCDIDGCDGELHEPYGEDGDMHRFARTKFDEGEVEVDAYFSNGTYFGSVVLEGISDSMSPAELRAKADIYDELPALLRQYADTLEARRAEALVAQFGIDSLMSEIYYACKEQGVDWGAVTLSVLERAGTK
jgi:hypothetical protein